MAPEKVKQSSPWKYFGWVLTSSSVCPQKVTLATDVTSLHNAQTLIGDLQWVRNITGLRNDEIAPLMPLLHGTSPQCPVQLSDDQRRCLQHLGNKITGAFADHCFPDEPIGVLVFNQEASPFAMLCQWPAWQKEKGGNDPVDNTICSARLQRQQQQTQAPDKATTKRLKTPDDKFALLEWVFTSHTPPMSIWARTVAIAHLIRKARTRTLKIGAMEPAFIALPLKAESKEWMLQHSEPLQVALLAYPGDVIDRYPKDARLQMLGKQLWLETAKVPKRPVEVHTLFTDAGKQSRKAACTWLEGTPWKHYLVYGTDQDSLQTLELAAVAWALIQWRTEPLTVVSDSLYVVGVVMRIEDALIKPPSNP